MSALLESEFELLPQAPSERTSREAQATAPSFVARVMRCSLLMGRSAAFDEVIPSLLGKFHTPCILGSAEVSRISWELMQGGVRREEDSFSNTHKWLVAELCYLTNT